MRKMIALALLCGACSYTTTVRVPGKMPSTQVIKLNAPMYLSGLAGATVVAPCDPAIVETYRGFVDRLAWLLTIGLYSPGTVVVTCAVAPRATVPVKVRAPAAPATQAAAR